MTTDLFLTRRSFDLLTSDRAGVDLTTERGDIKLVKGRANLAQAVLNRLFTRRGELAGLGHPDYGSRLYQLIGEPNTRRSQAVAELYIREALAGEPRIREIVAIIFEPPSLRADKRNVMELTLAILPVDEDEPLTIGAQIPL
ncbi:MAG: GPW/gp25 family protein [Anaerolineae bacterium]|nr:GPW/gp25 family protein [Anaerolineae bacterium]